MGRSLIFLAWPTRKPQTSSHSPMVTQHFSSGSGISQAVTLLSWSLCSTEEVLRKKSRNSPWTSCNDDLLLNFANSAGLGPNCWQVCGNVMTRVVCQCPKCLTEFDCHLQRHELDCVDWPVHVVHHPGVELHKVLGWDHMVSVQIQHVVEKVGELVSLKVSQ